MIRKIQKSIKNITNKELETISEKAGKKYGKLLFSEKIHSRYPNFLEVLEDKKVKNPKKVILKLRKIIEEKLIREIDYLSHIMYYYMEKIGDFGAPGEQRVSISQCRFMLKIPNTRAVNQFDADKFRELVEKERKRLNINNLNTQDLKNILKKSKFHILGQEFETFHSEKINFLLYFIGSNKRLSSGYYGTEEGFIIGDAIPKEVEGYKVSILTSEDARTPNNVLSIAAVIGHKEIFIRRESCRTIFYNKWVKIFDYDPYEYKKIMNDDYGNISETIKKKTIKLYDVKNKKDLTAAEDTFLDEMIDTILHHEFGHGLTSNNILDPELSVVGEVTQIYGENLITLIKEFLADWIPQMENSRGPIQNIIDIALKDKDIKKATRMLYMYMSDSWFYDTGEIYMYPHTDLMMAILLKYIKKDGSFDFGKLSKDLSYDLKKTPEENLKTIYGHMLHYYIQSTKYIMTLIKNAKFKLQGGIRTFQYVAVFLHNYFKQKAPQYTEHTVHYREAFWNNMLKYVSRFSPETDKKIKEYISMVNKDILKNVLIDVAGEEIAKKYNFNIRNYVVDKMKSYGFYEEIKKLKTSDALKLIMDDMFISDKEKKEAAKSFLDIMKENEIKITINYAGPPQPFYLVFQELLKKSQFGNIENGMTIGNPVIDYHLSEKEKEKILDEKLNQLVGYFDRQAFKEVQILRIDDQFLSAGKIREIIDRKSLLNGEKLSRKIHRIEFAFVRYNNLLEVYTPIKVGYPCWNTAQAVWRINQALRPSEQNKEWIIDKKLIQSLCSEYLKQY